MILAAYILPQANDTMNNKGGVITSLQSYYINDLGGNEPFVCGNTVPTGYQDVSSITNWDSYGMLAGQDFKSVKYQIQLICTATGYANLSVNERIIANKYFASGVEYNNSDVTAAQQDIYFSTFFKPNSDECRKKRDSQASGYLMKMVYMGSLPYETVLLASSACTLLRTLYLRDGVCGIGYGDAVSGVMNFINCDSNYSPYTLVSINTTNSIFTFSGNVVNNFSLQNQFRIYGSTSNDAMYTPTAITFDGTNTEITVSQKIASGTADGKAYCSGFLSFNGITNVHQLYLFNLYQNGIY